MTFFNHGRFFPGLMAVIILCLVPGVCLAGQSANNCDKAVPGPFVDVPDDHEAADAIEYLIEVGFIVGYPDGTFRGEGTFSRDECAMVFSRLFDRIYEELLAEGMDIWVTGQEQPNRFDDIPIDWVLEHWGGERLAKQGLLSLKYPDGDFHGDDQADRLDCAVFFGRLWERIAGLYREIGIEISTASDESEFPYEDITDEDYGYDAVKIVFAEGLMPGYPDGYWHPEYPVTRYDVMILLAGFHRRIFQPPCDGVSSKE